MADLNMRILLSAVGAQGVLSSFSSISDAGSSLSKALLGIGVVAAGAAIGLGVTAVKAAGDFQSSLTTLVTGAGESTKNIGMVSDGILKLAVDTGTSTKQLTDGMYMIESAGYHGATGLQVLKAAAMGAKVGNADLGTVADATTTIMTDFADQNVTASQAVNTLVATVSNGKTTMQALSSSLSQIMPTASAAKISLTDTSAAMATMTGEGVPAANAATYLRQTIIGLQAPSKGAITALKDVGLSSTDVADEMKKSLPNALKMITDAVGKKFPEGSAGYVNAIKNISGGSKTMQGMLDLTGSHMQTFLGNVHNISSAVKQGGGSISGWAQVQQNFNFKMQQLNEVIQTTMIRIGQQLLPVVTNVASGLLHLVSIGGQVVSFFQHNAAAMTALKVVAMAFAGVVITALVAGFYLWASAAIAAAIPTLALLWPFLLIGAAIGAVVGGFILAYNHITPFRNAVNAVAQVLSGMFMTAIRAIGNFLTSTFAPVWQQLVQIFNSQIKPAFMQLLSALAPVGTVLKVVGAIIAGVVVVAFGLLVGILSGVVKGFAGMLAGIAQALAGAIQVVTGFVHLVIGIFQAFFGIFIGLATGNWSTFQAGISNMASGVVGIFTGLWDMIKGSFSAFWGAISGLVSGFISSVIGFFTNLADTLVGHSIVPDMINSIINFFTQLPGRALSAVSSLVSMLGGFFTNLASQAIQWGSNIITSLASGITGAIGNVTSAISNVASAIGNFLPHSPAKEGELSHLNEYGPALVTGFSNGILQSIPMMSDTMGQLTGGIGAALAMPLATGFSADPSTRADQLSFGSAPTMIYSGTRKPRETTAAKKEDEEKKKEAHKLAEEHKKEARKLAEEHKKEARKAAEAEKKHVHVVINEIKHELHIHNTNAKLTKQQVNEVTDEAMHQFGKKLADEIRSQFGNV